MADANGTQQQSQSSAPLDAADFRIEVWPLDRIQPNPNNYRKHPEEQLQHLEHSLREFGWYKNVVIKPDGTLIAGEGIVTAAKRAGFTHAPVLVFRGTDAEALKMLVADNEVWRGAFDDDRHLSELLKQVRDETPTGLLGTGFDDMKLAALVMISRPESEIADFDEAAEWVGMPSMGNELRTKYAAINLWFENEDDRNEFLETHPDVIIVRGNRAHGAAWTAWWPPAKAQQYGKQSMAWVDEERMDTDDT